MATRTRLVNHIHGVLKSFGHRVKKYAAPGFHRQVVDQIPDELRASLQPILDTLAALAEQIPVLDREMRRLSTAIYPETSLLNQVGGATPSFASPKLETGICAACWSNAHSKSWVRLARTRI